jgi:hypothetical protein
MNEVMYHYFVTFKREDGTVGQIGISMPFPIESMHDIETVCQKIQSDRPEGGQVVLTNFPSLMRIEGLDSIAQS